jgi:predicted DCC family thiol-disulfide oxidoreductase YuxK
MNKLIVFYDNWCPNCSRFIKIVKKTDWLNLVEVKKLREEQVIKSFSSLDFEKAKKQMASFKDGIWNYGFKSLFLIFIRLPIFWITFPFFLLLKITGVGQILYTQLAINRKIIPLHCDEDTCGI